MKTLSTLSLMLCFALIGAAQNASIKGQLQDQDAAPVAFANVALYSHADSTLVKVETSDESGIFQIKGLSPGSYWLEASFVGVGNVRRSDIQLTANQQLDLEVLKFGDSGIELNEVTVTAQRAMVEVKPDRTVFNVQGTINSVGSDAISLLRKAPGVTVDNNDNINVLGRAGVLLYVDGKRLPLTGEDLSNFLQNLPAEQIDRIDIITNPGAKYEAEGNAGIIDIRLKRDKSHGTNGTVNGTFSHGELPQMNGNISINHRNKWMNAFGSLGGGDYERFDNMVFRSFQNGLFLDETNEIDMFTDNVNFRVGTDFYLAPKHTLGVLVSGNYSNGRMTSENIIGIYQQDSQTELDSLLIADSKGEWSNDRNTFNLNYRFDNKKGKTLNIDLDYGAYDNDRQRVQPNRYYKDLAGQQLLTEVINTFDTPTKIDIYTAKVDFENNIGKSRIGAGAKYSRVESNNVFLFFDQFNGVDIRNDRNSNIFDYDENVYAAYLSFNRPLSEKWNLAAGVRTEYTDILGDLQPFLPELQEPPVDTSYLSWFPNLGLTYQAAPMHAFSLNYGRRINRPDYNVLNPFNNQLSQLSYEKGNPFLFPEIVNNVELGYTWQYRYNFKIAYSLTTDQITRLIAPDEIDPRAGFITWANLATQEVWSGNISAPVQVSKKWNAYFNFSASFIDNQADYGDGAVVDVQAFTYILFQQHTFNLPWKLTGEISGFYSGPGVWGGVFEYESNWSLNVGLQRKFLNDQLNVRISANDLFYQTGWDGVSNFDGLRSSGSGRWDSRRAAISVSYNFGNENVRSRKRKTGLEEEAKRVGG